MKKEDFDEFRNLLNAQRAEVSGALSNHSGMRVGRKNMPDVADEAAARLANEVEGLIGDSEANLLEKIDLALTRIEDGTYGTCAECNGRIPKKRLRAKPSASLCVDCQEAKEAREAR